MRALAVACAALALAGAAAADAGGPTAEVTMPGRVYAPAELDVLVGTTVTWRNTDVSTHTVTADDGSFDSGYLGTNATYSQTFSKPGTYAFHCTIHRFMRGVVRVYSVVLQGPTQAMGPGARAVLTGLAPAGTSAVTLERLADGDWSAVATVSPRADGTFAFRVAAPAPVEYRVRADATASRPVRIAVRPVVVARAAGGRVSATSTPPLTRAQALLQAYDRERFAYVTVARATLDAAGRVSFPFRASRPTHLRVVVRAGGGWSDGASRGLLVRPTKG